MRFKYFKRTALAVLMALIMVGCMDDNITLYDGPPLVEFALQSGNPRANYSWNSTGRFWAGEIRGTAFPDTAVQVQLIGPHQSQAIEVGYYIAQEVYRDFSKNRLVAQQPEGVEGADWVKLVTTATEGTDYQLLDGGVITIPAGSSFGKLRLSTSPTGDRFLYIVLTERDLKPNVNANIFRLRIRP